MLLRASRASELLVKEAIVGSIASLGARSAKGMGRFAWKHKKGLGAGAMITGYPALQAADAIRRSNIGMTPQWTAAQMRGQVGRIPNM